MKRILVTGATGQIGSELTLALRKKYKNKNVLAAGHKREPSENLLRTGPFEYLDICDRENLEEIVKKYQIDTIFHLAAVLSGIGEKKPQLAWRVNISGLRNILEVAKNYRLVRLFWPSSIAVFGPESPKVKTPQETILIPRTIYGVTKVAGELLCNFYFVRYNLDVRSIRFPGIISNETLPGGGTTDYAVEMFYEAIKKKRYTCFVKENTILPMMYMPDCIKATMNLMETEKSRIKCRIGYNVNAMSFSAEELAAEIKKHVPRFECVYKPDFRQRIADSWPRSIDDSVAKKEWNWTPEYDLSRMTEDMIKKMIKRFDEGKL